MDFNIFKNHCLRGGPFEPQAESAAPRSAPVVPAEPLRRRSPPLLNEIPGAGSLVQRTGPGPPGESRSGPGET